MPALTEEQSAQLKQILQVSGTNYYGAGSGNSVVKNIPKPVSTTPAPGNGFLDKVGAVLHQGANIGGAVATGLGKFALHTGQDIVRQGVGAFKTAVDIQTQPAQEAAMSSMNEQLGRKQDQIIADYKAGKMSKQNYVDSLHTLSQQFQGLSKQSQAIYSGPSPQQRASDVANTAINILTLGSLSLEKAGAKEVVESGVRNLGEDSLTNLEKLVTKVPAVRALVERNAAGALKASADEDLLSTIAREGKNVLTGLLIKRPIFYQSNIQSAKGVLDNLMKGNYDSAVKSSAWLSTQMLEGGPIGAFYKGGKWLKATASKLAYGKGSFIDEVSKRIGNGNPTQIVKFMQRIEREAPAESADIEKTFRILQETNLQASNENLSTAVDNVLNHYTQHGIDLKTLTPETLYKDMKNWVDADALAQKTLRSGLIKDIPKDDAGKYVVVRWDTPTKKALADAVAQTDGSLQQMNQVVTELADRPGVGWGNNRILMNKIENVLNTSGSAEEAGNAIKEISTASTLIDGVPSKVAAELERLGYSITAPFGGRKTPILSGIEDTRKLVTGALDHNTDVFDVATNPEPNLAAFAGAISRAGLSPKASNDVASRVLGESLVANLDELHLGTTLGLKDSQGADLVNGGRAILGKLQGYIENKKPVFGLGRSAAITDVRQLRVGEIQEALGVSGSEAKSVSKALIDAYTKIPLEFRGAGDKAVDLWYKVNPLQKYYSRIQSALRYSYNPFFRAQERVETKLLSHAQANNLIWGKSRDELNEAAKLLDKSGIFASSLPGEAAQQQVFGRITANITQGQKRDLAGLALDMAKSRGITLQQMVNEHSDEVDDALRVVVQYGRHGVLSSPLARTMSTAFFPMRYNLKVTKLAADVLAKQPPSVQLAVLHSLHNTRDWLKSDEGIKWQATHADAIQVFNWLTPINSIAYTLNLLGHPPDSISDLGQLGGLPFGFISQILDSAGIINLNKPYVDPKTGAVIPDYIPKSIQAKAATSLVDILGTMFTYPGRTLGLPGKQATLNKLVQSFIATKGSDFDKQINLDELTPLQKQWVKVLKGDTSQETVDKLYHSPADGQFNWYTLPPLRLELPEKGQVLTRSQVAEMKAANKGGAKPKNKALPIPAQ